MKKVSSFLVFIGIILSVHSVYSQSVAVDSTFGENGMAVIPNTTEISFFDFDNNGNIIAVGYTLKGSVKYDLTIAKTNEDGIVDESFGNNGLAKVTDYDKSVPLGLKITNDNKIIVIGTFTEIQFQGGETMIMRFKEDGTVDENFGDNGKVNLNFNIGSLISLNFDNDDFMLIARRDNYQSENQFPYIAKYNYEGELDTSFVENGTIYLTNSIIPYRMKILNDGSIIIAGTYNTFPNTELGLCKLTPIGEIDTNFANGGVWHLNTMQDFDMDHEYFDNVFEDSNGNLVLSGSGFTNDLGWGNRPFLSRFYSNGTPDTNFAENGFYCLDTIAINKPIFQIGDKYVIAGRYGNHKIAFVDSSGSFANVVYTCEIYYSQDMKLQGNNKIILGGGYKIDNTYNANFALERITIGDGHVGIVETHNYASLRIFPNPVNEQLTVSLAGGGKGVEELTIEKIEIYDVVGQLLYQTTNKQINNEISIDISHLAAGMYFIKFDDHRVEKFVKY